MKEISMKLKKGTVNSMKSVALAVSTASANTKCMCLFHQPEKPAELRRLRKF